jgi:rod shape determining protein RodA
MVDRNNIIGNIDWISIFLWLAILAFGWMNIYSANILEAEEGVFDFSQRFGKQIFWIGAAVLLAVMILLLDAKFYIYFAFILYALIILLLMFVLVFGTEINGARSWFVIGGFQIQPSEFAKPLTALALASLMTSHYFNIRKFWHLVQCGLIIFAAPLLILLQPDMGSTLVYLAFIFVLFREGFSSSIMILLALMLVLFMMVMLLDKALLLLILTAGALLLYQRINRSLKNTMIIAVSITGLFGVLYLAGKLTGKDFTLFTLGLVTILPVALVTGIIGLNRRAFSRLKVLGGLLIAIAFVISVDYGMHNILKPHQQYRIYVTLGLEDDPQGVGYNVNQSKIAIGSGGFLGKGYLKGTQTKLHFVPEQTTDFIFCTVGEEWGFVGTTFVILTYLGLMLRMIMLAERQRSAFSRIFGYGFISVLFTHFLVNIGMTIGLLPVIGIPLPFFSYGGSSLWAFTIFLFIFLRLDASRLELLR